MELQSDKIGLHNCLELLSPYLGRHVFPKSTTLGRQNGRHFEYYIIRYIIKNYMIFTSIIKY